MHPTPGKILLIQLRRIGDTILLTPALDALREGWPLAKIHLLTEYPASDLFEGDDRVDLLWLRPPRQALSGLARELRREKYDLAIDFQSLPITSLLARISGATTVGFRRRFRWYHHPVALQDHRGTGYAADHKLDLLRALGIQPRAWMPSLRIPAPPDPIWETFPGSPRVVLSPVSPWPHKRWSALAFGQAARAIHARTGAAFVVAGGPGEEGQVEEVARHLAGIPHRTRVAGRIREFSSLVAGSDLFLGNDNGPRHMAVARGIPTVGYFSEVNPIPWTPPGPLHPVLWDLAHSGGRYVPSDRTILPPRPEEAAEAAVRLLESAALRSAPSKGSVPSRGGTA